MRPWRASLLHSKQSRSMRPSSARAPRRGLRCSSTSRCFTIGSACTQPWATEPRPRLAPAWRRSPCARQPDILISPLHTKGGGPRVTKFAFVAAERANHAVATLCRVVGASVSGFYAWLRAIPSRQNRAEAQAELRGHISRIFAAKRRVDGAPRIHAELRREGHRHARRWIERLMRNMGLQASRGRRRKPAKSLRLLSASGVVELAHATRPATRVLSRALPRRRALCTNWK